MAAKNFESILVNMNLCSSVMAVDLNLMTSQFTLVFISWILIPLCRVKFFNKNIIHFAMNCRSYIIYVILI